MKQEAPFLHFARDSFSNSCTLYIYMSLVGGKNTTIAMELPTCVDVFANEQNKRDKET